MEYKLYKKCAVTLEKPFKVERLDVYLETLDVITLECNTQVNCNKLTFDVVLTFPQEYIIANNLEGLNYAEIEGRYYFITNIAWRSTHSALFTMYLDTVNSIDYEFSERTQIQREHHDRYIEDTYHSTGSGTGAAMRYLDLVDEGINPTLYLQNDTILQDENEDNNFYAVYRTRETLSERDIANPLECYIASDELLKISNEGSSHVLLSIGAGLHNNYLYFFTNEDNPNGRSTDNSGNSYHLGERKALLVKVLNNQATATVVTYDEYGRYVSNTVAHGFDAEGYMDFARPYRIGYAITINSDVAFNTFTIDYLKANKSIFVSVGAGYAEYINNIERYDKTDAKLVKIIKLPYNPSSALSFNENTGLWNYDPQIFEFAGGELRLIDLDYKFENDITLENAWWNLEINFSGTDRKAAKYKDRINSESKLYTSAFTQYRYIYDSAIFPVMLEYADSEALIDMNYTSDIKFYFTSTVNSKFAFEFPNARLSNNKYALDAYPSYLIIGRNNEEPIYNNAYVNYIRTGYNYDVKSKERNNFQAWFGAGVGAVGAAASLATGNAIGTVSFIGMTTSNVQHITSTIMNTVNNEESLQAHQRQLIQSATSVYGSDDVDLMTRYSANKLHLQRWSVSKEVREQLEALFHYFGYKSVRTGKPSRYGNRYRFNYTQCNAEFTNISRYDRDIQEDLKSRYAQGVTHIHFNPADDYAKWDFAQEYENWELWLVQD